MILGEAAAAGIARGPAVICHCDEPMVVPRRIVTDAELPAEMARLDAAITAAGEQLRALEAAVQAGPGPAVAAIFAAQWQMLHDPTLHDEIARQCLHDKINIEAAVSDAASKLIAAFGRIDDPIVRERAVDVRDVARRLLRHLLKSKEVEMGELPAGSIIVARELLPSLASGLGRFAALVSERGGTTAHAVILARSLGIPVVIHADGAAEKIHDGDALIVDGLAGRVFIEPSPEVQREYERIEKDLKARRHALKEFVDLPAVTHDGVAIKLSANAGTVADASAAAASRAEGIGLYRTEFAFLVHPQFPTEEQQYRLYRAAADHVQPHETVLRVLDIGSDKLLPYFPLPPEANPSLGRRGTRLLLGYPEILRAQLRAILRLSATHPVSLLFPMIGGVDEFMAARQAVEDAKAELLREHEPFNSHIRVGAMIETASAAIMARWIAREADFLSVGTNDLVQYLLTSDRTSSAMAGYYEPLHPAVVQTIKYIVEAAAAEGKPVSLCGEIAGNPAYTELLLGLGVTALSVAPGEVLDLKRVIRSVRLSDAHELANRALAVGTTREVKACLGASVRPNDEGIFQRRAVQRWRGEGGGGP